MSTFRILTAIVMISFSLALMATHATASRPESSCEVGYGSSSCFADYMAAPLTIPPGCTALPWTVTGMDPFQKDNP